jgi:hypothetical protein
MKVEIGEFEHANASIHTKSVVGSIIIGVNSKTMSALPLGGAQAEALSRSRIKQGSRFIGARV